MYERVVSEGDLSTEPGEISPDRGLPRTGRSPAVPAEIASPCPCLPGLEVRSGPRRAMRTSG
jgi:hypothetical protein